MARSCRFPLFRVFATFGVALLLRNAHAATEFPAAGPCATGAHVAFWQPEPAYAVCARDATCEAALGQWKEAKSIWQGTEGVSFGNYLGRNGTDLRNILLESLAEHGEELDGEGHLTLHYSEVTCTESFCTALSPHPAGCLHTAE